MSDDLATALATLAPEVDEPASRELFERRRSRATSAGSRRWLVAAVVTLVVGGLVGVWSLGRGDDGTVPLDPPADPSSGPLTEGDGYETVLVTETDAGYGDAWLVTDQAGYDEIMNPGSDVPAIDFDRVAVLVMTRPDNACADTITRFEREPGDSGPILTPVFEDLSSACEDPLLSWLYVVAIDRSVLGDAATIRIPGAEVFGVDEQLLEWRAGPDTSGSTDPDGDAGTPADPTTTLEATGITVPIPAVGEPALHNTSVGLVWVVAHDDGSVSVLPAVIDGGGVDDTGVSPLGRLVFAAADGSSFGTGRSRWDAHGRAVTDGRENDLVGFETRPVADGDGADVEIMISGAARIDGAPEFDPDDVADIGDLTESTDRALRRAVGEPLDLGTFRTLSSSGPIWRYLDLSLVVEDGVGRLCDVPVDLPVPDLPTCADAGGDHLDTIVTSDRPDITSWFHGPVLAWQDPVRGFTRIVPMAGYSSRNDDVFEGNDPPEVEPPETEPADADSWRDMASGLVDDSDQLLPYWAVDQAQYDEMTGELGFGAEAAIDWESELVVTFATTHNSCVPTLRTIVDEGDLVRPSFRPAIAETCDDIGLASAWIVALDRSAMDDATRFEIPGDSLSRGAGTVTIDTTDGSVIDGGAVVTDQLTVECPGSPGTPIHASVASVIDRDLSFELRSPDGNVLTESGNDRVGRTPVELEAPVTEALLAAVSRDELELIVRTADGSVAGTTSVDTEQFRFALACA